MVHLLRGGLPDRDDCARGCAPRWPQRRDLRQANYEAGEPTEPAQQRRELPVLRAGHRQEHGVRRTLAKEDRDDDHDDGRAVRRHLRQLQVLQGYESVRCGQHEDGVQENLRLLQRRLSAPEEEVPSVWNLRRHIRQLQVVQGQQPVRRRQHQNCLPEDLWLLHRSISDTQADAQAHS